MCSPCPRYRNYYELVREGKWTIDVIFEGMKAATDDLDGDGKMTVSDQWGMSTNTHSNQQLFYGLGETMIKKAAADVPYWTVDNESYLNAFIKMSAVVASEYSGNASIIGSHPDAIFGEGRALFSASLLASARAELNYLRGSEVNLGVLPPPKLNEQQEHYYSYFDYSTSCIGLVTMTKIELTGLL